MRLITAYTDTAVLYNIVTRVRMATVIRGSCDREFASVRSVPFIGCAFERDSLGEAVLIPDATHGALKFWIHASEPVCRTN